MKPSLQGELEVDVEIKAPPTKFYHMLTAPQDMTKATPDFLQGYSVKEGDVGSVGNLITWNYVLDGKPQVVTERIEAMDPKNNMIQFREIEGDLMKELTSLLFTIHVNPKQGGSGGVVKWHMAYERINENVAHPENLLQMCVKMSKDMDEMLLSME
ncbi:unnamed protein product [Eruca vesicaria subsp. sativa]|uniref:Bet v I/Major latex protein domain-containing protein n=1 Tax=Eruca vesicaria subsp. sativa TaxID=29727 RepID=A0ABC8K2J4_ERUVS|nr:unnamed protein product [Eruca vesicaria subsp. sativa]